jgi:hypothetical protein
VNVVSDAVEIECGIPFISIAYIRELSGNPVYSLIGELFCDRTPTPDEDHDQPSPDFFVPVSSAIAIRMEPNEQPFKGLRI